MEMFGDIETIPAQRQDVINEIGAELTARAEAEIAALAPPGNYKKAETIEDWHANVKPGIISNIRAGLAEKIDAEYRKTGLDGAYGQIAVISLAFNDDEPEAFYVKDYTDPKAELITLFRAFFFMEQKLSHGRTCTEIGFNWVNFDRRRLIQRSYINGILPHRLILRELKPWEPGISDVMVMWTGYHRDFISMDKLLRAFGLGSKGDVDGSMVWDMVKAGKIDDVAAYCCDDVRKTRALYRRMTRELVDWKNVRLVPCEPQPQHPADEPVRQPVVADERPEPPPDDDVQVAVEHNNQPIYVGEANPL